MKKSLIVLSILFIFVSVSSGELDLIIPYSTNNKCDTVYFEAITSDCDFISKIFGGCLEDWVTIISTKPPGEYNRRIYYIYGDVFRCSQNRCYVGQDFCIDLSNYEHK